ncbi:lipid-A-disaccharide synthase [Leptolyngbya sp. 'hensonii']|uniref:lipid-A-disaccharide synthase n=1 Tax=Leptolyngbya sp. 'hensonii' TaxID=1922337 RepID=UPI00094FAC46|nr:lipid-A-disaccharide synthase [Leptolyngbya sp. 'hensonii']OLP17366.1 lipid-A-disaccharide synthase [Leptolyngbya sp. 'hensonii']
MQAIDILILSNGPGELTTWVKPVVAALREKLGADPDQVRLSVVLSPCTNATGKEAEIARSYPEVDRVQAADRFFPFLLWGQTADRWDWRDRGVVIFLGGDQFFSVVIGKRLGYPTVTYAEWEARWPQWIDRFAVMKPAILDRVNPQYTTKFTVVGDLMAEAGSWSTQDAPSSADSSPLPPLIGILPGSKAAKLAQGVPLMVAIADHIHRHRPEVRFVIPVAPSLELVTLANFANPDLNPVFSLVEGVAADLVLPEQPESGPYLKTASGMQVDLWTTFPAYEVMAQCSLCITTVGANTAELGALGIPMVVLIPKNQADAMRTWDGLPGLLANLPGGFGSFFARLINRYMEKRLGLLAWPNIWAGEAIVPELFDHLRPEGVADLVMDYLDHPEKLQQMRDNLRKVRGEPGAAKKLAAIVAEVLSSPP